MSEHYKEPRHCWVLEETEQGYLIGGPLPKRFRLKREAQKELLRFHPKWRKIVKVRKCIVKYEVIA